MEPVRDFADLRVYQGTFATASEFFRGTKQLPVEERYSLPYIDKETQAESHRRHKQIDAPLGLMMADLARWWCPAAPG